ncbi:uncharacterized protein LOC119080996 isoform X3 [Bradysia coprophila]|uniref:uncharacterized protein LOC119080996 isoform X3 n=1 Tax=Bradysia coprophila TaxID=38358 RepID=UPI00187DC40B|nr:uncharacterized protein LOC119080996 isoform X3 [Bradysia coprophila]
MNYRYYRRFLLTSRIIFFQRLVREFSGSSRTNRARAALVGSNSNNINNNNIATTASLPTNATTVASSSRQTDEGLAKAKVKETTSAKLDDSTVNDSTETITSETNTKEAMDTSDSNSVLEADEVTEDCFQNETKEETENSNAVSDSNQSEQPEQPKPPEQPESDLPTETKDIVDPIVDEIVTKGIDKSSTSVSNMNSGSSLETVPDGGGTTAAETTASSSSQRTNIRFVRKSLENTTLSVMYSKSYYDTDTIETEYPRNFDDNIELLSRETEHLEEQFTASEEKLLHYVPIYDPKKFEEQRQQQKKDDDEDEPIGMSPCGRFFKYDKEVGRGSFKTVFRGLDTQTGVAVAWCELLDKKVNKAERQRFREEADMLKKLQHPNIVRFYNYWETSIAKKKNIVLVTELMLSGTLKSYLRRFKKINPKVLKSWCRQILKGLYFLHSRTPPIIHRDLKCDNIFITGTTGSVKIGDLGLATLKNRSFAKSVIGTPEFMAPEMYEEHYDEAVDVYAFGMCMLEMATSEYPYNECSGPAQIYKKVVNGHKPASFDKVENPEVKEIIEKCIQLQKEDRPGCKELLNSEFFSEDLGIKLEPISKENFLNSAECNKIEFRLRLLDSKKRTYKHKENEAIQFEFDIVTDNAEDTASEMLKAAIISEEDARAVSKLLKVQVSSMLKERREKRAQHQLELENIEKAALEMQALQAQHAFQNQLEQQQVIEHQMILNEQHIQQNIQNTSNFVTSGQVFTQTQYYQQNQVSQTMQLQQPQQNQYIQQNNTFQPQQMQYNQSIQGTQQNVLVSSSPQQYASGQSNSTAVVSPNTQVLASNNNYSQVQSIVQNNQPTQQSYQQNQIIGQQVSQQHAQYQNIQQQTPSPPQQQIMTHPPTQQQQQLMQQAILQQSQQVLQQTLQPPQSNLQQTLQSPQQNLQPQQSSAQGNYPLAYQSPQPPVNQVIQLHNQPTVSSTLQSNQGNLQPHQTISYQSLPQQVNQEPQFIQSVALQPQMNLQNSSLPPGGPPNFAVSPQVQGQLQGTQVAQTTQMYATHPQEQLYPNQTAIPNSNYIIQQPQIQHMTQQHPPQQTMHQQQQHSLQQQSSMHQQSSQAQPVQAPLLQQQSVQQQHIQQQHQQHIPVQQPPVQQQPQVPQQHIQQQQVQQQHVQQQPVQQQHVQQQPVQQQHIQQQQVQQQYVQQQQPVQQHLQQHPVQQQPIQQHPVQQQLIQQLPVQQQPDQQQSVQQQPVQQQTVQTVQADQKEAFAQHQMTNSNYSGQIIQQQQQVPQEQQIIFAQNQQHNQQSISPNFQQLNSVNSPQLPQNPIQVPSQTPVQQPVQSQSQSLSSSPNPTSNITKTPTTKQKSRRSNKSTERVPKLVVMSVQNGTLVDCSMDNKLKTITFKFDISDVNPVEVANDLISKDLLSESQSVVFADMVRDIVRQLKLNPNQIPVPTASRRNVDKVRHASLTRQRSPFKTHQRHRSRDEMSMTKMFDPTIYSLQPLVTTPVTIPSQAASTTSASSSDTQQNISDHDPSPSSDGHSGSSSLKDIVVLGEDQKGLRDYQTDGNYEELDTISRKTSTASEYTSLSDYTPENTVTRESSVTTSTLRNDFADECIDRSDALPTGEFIRSDESCVIQMTDKPASGEQDTASTLVNENVRSPDVDVPPAQMQRARKISRFLVTPSVVSIDCDNIDELQHEQQPKPETPFDGQPNTIHQQIYNEDGTVVNIQQFDASQQQMIYSQNNQQPGLGYSSDMIDANLMNDLRNQTIEQYNATMPNKPLGPESINTLEQLKIGLENITHAHVQTKSKDSQPTVSEAIKSTGQISDEQLACMVEGPLSYADVTAGGTVQIMNEITGQQFEPVADIYPQQHPIVQQLQSPQTGIQLAASSPQQSNIGAVADPIITSTSENMSQTTSVYNSRRTSAELAAFEQYNRAANDTVTLDNVESAERKLSQQGSIDKQEIAPQQPQNTLAALQLKLAQLTSGQQPPGQSEQPVLYQQIDEQHQQVYTGPSQDLTETSQLQQEQQQSQLNSPTVQLDINQLKLTSTQSSSAVSTPVIEQNETVFPQTADQPNTTSVTVQPKQLSDLEQELAKIHQKRYNKDQQPPSNPPVELLSNIVQTANAPNTQAIPTLPINASQTSHAEQPVGSVHISIPTASADSNDNALNVPTQQAARKISRFQVSVVSEATPPIQVQPQDSVRTLQTNAPLVSSSNSGVDEQRHDYGAMNFQNFTNSTGGSELTDQFVEQTSREQYGRDDYYRSMTGISDQNQVPTQLKTQKPLVERNTTATKFGSQKATNQTGAREKTRKKSSAMGVRTRSLSQNLQQIFQPFQRGANASLRSSTQSVATIDKDAPLNRSNYNFSYEITRSSSDKFENSHQSETSSGSMTHRNATPNMKGNKLSRFQRSKSISSPYIPKTLHTRTSAELNKQLLSKAVAENRFLVKTIQKYHQYDIARTKNDMTFQPIYQNAEVIPKLRTRHSKLIQSNLKPFYSRQNSIEEHQNAQGYSQSFDNLLSNEFPPVNKSRKKYSRTKSSTLVSKPSSLSLPFGGSCGNLNVSPQKNHHDQTAYRTIHGTSVSVLPVQQSRLHTIFKFVRTGKEVPQPTTNDYSNSDTFDEYDDGSLTDSSSSDMSCEMDPPPVLLKQSSSLSSVPNVQRMPFRSKRADRFTRMQSLDFTQSQTNVPMINPKIKNTSRTVPHSRTGSPVSSPLQSRAVTPTYFDLENRSHPQQQFFKSLNQQQYNNSMMGGINSMASYGCHQTTKLTMPMINLPKKSSSMSTMVAATPKNLNSGTSLSNIVWQNSPLDFKHNLEYARNIISTMQLEPKSRQQLQLLLQRQHLEEEELRLRHYMELEKFQKNLDSANQWMENMSATTSAAPSLQTSQPQIQYSMQNRPSQQGTIVIQQSQQQQSQMMQQPTLSSTTPFQLNSTALSTTTTTFSPTFNSFPSYMESQQIDAGTSSIPQLQHVDHTNPAAP